VRASCCNGEKKEEKKIPKKQKKKKEFPLLTTFNPLDLLGRCCEIFEGVQK
jgi:hypothetical protein